jgi:hypothetical protein
MDSRPHNNTLCLLLFSYYKYITNFLIYKIKRLNFRRTPFIYSSFFGFQFFSLVAGLGVEPSISTGYEPGMIFRFTHPQYRLYIIFFSFVLYFLKKISIYLKLFSYICKTNKKILIYTIMKNVNVNIVVPQPQDRDRVERTNYVFTI